MWVVPASPPGTSSAMATSTGFSSKLGHSSGVAFLTTKTAASLMSSDLACGTAKPSVMPVSPMASRAMKAS